MAHDRSSAKGDVFQDDERCPEHLPGTWRAAEEPPAQTHCNVKGTGTAISSTSSDRAYKGANQPLKGLDT